MTIAMVQAVTPPCPMCRERSMVLVPERALNKWLSGEIGHVQDAFPDLSPSNRELLLTGTCTPCWDSLGSDEDDYDDEEVPF